MSMPLKNSGYLVLRSNGDRGRKDIGGEVKIRNLKKAQMLHERGYIVFPIRPNPMLSRPSSAGPLRNLSGIRGLGMVTEESFAKRIEELRRAGAKVYLSEDRGLQACGPCPGARLRFQIQARPSYRRWSRRRNRDESLEDDE